MADEVVSASGAAGGADSGGGGSSAGTGAGGGAGAADTSALSDQQFLESQAPKGDSTAIVKADETKAVAETTDETALIKPGSLEKEAGEPEWFATVKDAKASAAARELWKTNQEYAKHFKTPAELAEFFKDLPGGREEVAALQTLGKEVAELDTAIEGSDFAGHLTVAERVLNQAPANALSLTRAWAQAVAKHQPEAWRQASEELIAETLKANGIGLTLADLLSGIREMREAIAAQDSQAFGLAAQKLTAQPLAERREDPNLVKSRTEAQTAREQRDAALTDTWENNTLTNVNAVDAMVRQEAGTHMANILLDSAKALLDKQQGKREELLDKVSAEVSQQVSANSWVRSQITALVGSRPQKDGANTRNLTAGKAEWDRALQLSKDACKPLIRAATAKVISAWTKEVVAGNAAARAQAKGQGADRKDVGATTVARPAGKGRITEEMLRDSNLSDEELLSKF